MDNLLIAINTLKLAHLPNSTLIAIHLTSPTPFIPSNVEHLLTPDLTTTPPQATSETSNSRSYKRHSPASNEQTSNYFTTDEPFSPSASKFTQTGRLPRSVNSGSPPTNSMDSYSDVKYVPRWRRYSPPEEMSQATKRAMLVLTVTDISTKC
ncbi:hypothetical protein L9F63_021215 [Diploptera punctata]|uniref:Uncharacterized protein n=1 Tax=Diploptera punctata TaxID=6984 RepID=A0AAD8EBK8_DIPPU|nr:hypothetical protein L9F63_021215 [Diploptera punctata]